MKDGKETDIRAVSIQQNNLAKKRAFWLQPTKDIIVITPTKEDAAVKFTFIIIACVIGGLALGVFIGFRAYKRYQRTNSNSTYVFTESVVPDSNAGALLDEMWVLRVYNSLNKLLLHCNK